MSLQADSITTDIHCVTRLSKLDTAWRGVSVDTLLADVETEADYAMAHSYGGYSTNLPLDGKAWVAFEDDGEQLVPEHGGPAQLLVPHLYFWKSAKWVRGIELMLHDSPGFWEQLGYHDYGDPWREQRYQGIEATSHLAARSCARAAAGDTERLHSGSRSPAVAWTP
jgi:DMSO/TMAO reductase YedYZ molybdopterin-dependent catalytic subunit